MPIGIIVRGNALAQMLRRNRSLFEADVQRIHILVVGDPLAGTPLSTVYVGRDRPQRPDPFRLSASTFASKSNRTCIK